MNLEIWKHSFTADRVPPWPCPRCHHAALALERRSLFSDLTTGSKRDRRHEDWEPDWEKGRFSAIFRCSRRDCSEVVAVCGLTSVEPEPSSEDGDELLTTVYYPRYFEPTPDMFPIAHECPVEIQIDVRSAFALFWCDPTSCVGRIRSTLESMLNHLKVKRFRKDKKTMERRPLDLHARIEIFAKSRKFAGLRSTLLAVKWLGNAASHATTVDTDVALAALELLEHALNEVFAGHTARREKLEKKILAAKGPPHLARKRN